MEKAMDALIQKLRAFAQERDWDQFHSPKNLAMALSIEAGEIMEIFQWLTQAQSRALDADKLDKLKDEIGDVQIYLTMLADKFAIDPIQAAHAKVEKNRRNYPVAKAKGNALKNKEY